MTCTAHKFGGASVRDAEAIRRVAALLERQLGPEEKAVVVVSAMGKTTNALEEVWGAEGNRRRQLWDACVAEHVAVANELGLDLGDELHSRMTSCWKEATQAENLGDRAAAYDAFVAAGELASTTLVAGWLAKAGLPASWWDVRRTIQTAGPHRFARVDESTLEEVGASLRRRLSELAGRSVVVTQGFIGQHADGRTSTLGREGSDYSAALLAVAVGAREVTIWKDVPGMMNADPKRHPEAVTVPRVDHGEALELSYYGASVIHPRTVKPLQQAGLPLWVKSFVNPDGPSTCIDAFPGLVPDVPMFIWREDQMWLEVYTADGSFLAEDHLTTVFGALDKAGIHVRLMQQSATHFGLLADRDEAKLNALSAVLGTDFTAECTRDLVLLTVRHGTQEDVERLTGARDVLVEQHAGATWRRVLA
jgi:aspartate kinase